MSKVCFHSQQNFCYNEQQSALFESLLLVEKDTTFVNVWDDVVQEDIPGRSIYRATFTLLFVYVFIPLGRFTISNTVPVFINFLSYTRR